MQRQSSELQSTEGELETFIQVLASRVGWVGSEFWDVLPRYLGCNWISSPLYKHDNHDIRLLNGLYKPTYELVTIHFHGHPSWSEGDSHLFWTFLLVRLMMSKCILRSLKWPFSRSKKMVRAKSEQRVATMWGGGSHKAGTNMHIYGRFWVMCP